MVEATLTLSLKADPPITALKISTSSTVTASKDLLFCELSDGAVILALKSGVYYGLDPVGTRVWGLIQEARPVHSILAVLLEEYEVDATRCEEDLRVLLQNMVTLGLVEIDNDTP